ncbi:MAG: glycosyltransferase family 2 protein [Bradyrhizobium sp.]|uniref:glycosyltransferase family 2 protein n=1 Tax=Bradyrhizobium sp. TaxID=376 RepID=UPI0025C4F496|nr:glycosyltransferase family 2 protein [Bradyrhizobium sp.]MBI5265028.1 glycosyltransferase family 2 protein [Bradyrhizobium sp.]
MKIFSICCVRDENDIVGETLKAALGWSDRIFVFDNGSVDGTWDTVQDIAKANSKIEIVGHDDRTFTDEMRGEIYESYRSMASPGDWWCRLDSDEIYIDDPARFLAEVPDKYGFVLSATFNFYFTDLDLRSYEQSPSEWLARPVRERLKFYQNNWSEPRFVRHRNDLEWGGLIWPDNHGRTYPVRIRLRHYPYRSPAQISSRLEIRQRQPTLFKHEANRSLAAPKEVRPDWSDQYIATATFERASWQDRVMRAAECDVDLGDATLVSRNELMPPLPLPAVDLVKAGLQATPVGRAILSPLLKWRRSQASRR